MLSDTASLTLLFPVLPLFALKFGLNSFEIGLLVSCNAVCQFFSSIFYGRWSDRVGRKPVLAISQLGTVISLVLMAFAQEPWLLFIAVAIDGLTAGNVTGAMAYISDLVTPDRRATAFAHCLVAMNLGRIVGPLIAGLCGVGNERTALLFAARLAVLSLIATLTLLTESRKNKSGKTGGRVLAQDQIDDLVSYSDRGYDLLELTAEPKILDFKFIRTWKLWSILAQGFLFYLSTSACNRELSLFAQRQFVHRPGEILASGESLVSYFFAFSGVVAVISQLFLLNRFVRILGENGVIRLGLVLSVLGFVTLGISENALVLFPAAFLISLGTALIQPCILSSIASKVPFLHKGAALGLNRTMFSLALVISPPIAGLFLKFHSPYPWALLLAVYCAAAVLMNFYSAPRSMKLARESRS